MNITINCEQCFAPISRDVAESALPLNREDLTIWFLLCQNCINSFTAVA